MSCAKIAIIIPVFNRIKLTIQCLESLKKIVYPYYSIIIIDHGSTDETSDLIRRNYPYVILEKGDESMWWAKAMNIGIKKAISTHHDYVLFLNNDDEVDAFILTNLIECSLENPEAIIGCKVRNYDQPCSLIFAGGDYDWGKKGLVTYGDGEIDIGQYDLRKEIKWIPGAGTFVKVDYFQRIGFIDDQSFPHYAADIDFTLRAHKLGFRIIFEPKAILYKKMGRNNSSADRKQNMFKVLILPLFSIRSSINLPLQAKFLWKHCPKKHIPKMFFYKYYMVYKGFFRFEVFMRYFKYKFNKR